MYKILKAEKLADKIFLDGCTMHHVLQVTVSRDSLLS